MPDVAGNDKVTRTAWLAFALTFALMMSDYMSRQLANAAFPLIKADWQLSDTQLGSLVSVVALMVGALIIPVSLIVDRIGRVRSIAIMAVVWSLATIACGLATSFGSLFAARAVVGLGEAGYASAGGAILLQLFPRRLHAAVLGTFLSGSLFGSVLGMAVGGSLAQQHGWQFAFITVGSGGLLLALAYPLLVREPSRPRDLSGPRSLTLGQLARRLLATPTVVWTYIGLAGNMFVQASVVAWAPSYLNRYHGMEPALAARTAGLLVLASGLGMIGGGIVVGRFGGGIRSNRLRLPALFAAAAAAILFVAFQLPHGVAQLVLIGAGLAVGNLVIGAPGTVVTDAIPAASHATGLATMSLFMNLLGSAPGPIVAGRIADTAGLQVAMACVPLLLLVSATAFAMATRSHDRDLPDASDI